MIEDNINIDESKLRGELSWLISIMEGRDLRLLRKIAFDIAKEYSDGYKKWYFKESIHTCIGCPFNYCSSPETCKRMGHCQHNSNVQP